MKKLLIIIGILLYVCFQTNVNMCAQKPQEQTWGQWFWSKVNTPLAVVNREKLKQAAVTVPIAAATYNIDQIIPQSSSAVQYFGSMAPYVVTGYFAFLLGILAQELLHYAWGGDRAIAIKTIKDTLSKIVRNSLLYPTKSLQLNALIKKDDFLKYINISDPGAEDILNEACNQLAQEINAENYSKEQFEEENQIGAYIAQLKKQLNPLDSLEKQITDLQRMEKKQDSIIKMRGFLSLYYRLQNQLEVEKKLTPGQQEARRGFLSQKITRSEQEGYSEPYKKEIEISNQRIMQQAAERAKQAREARKKREMNEREIERLLKEKKSYFLKPGEYMDIQGRQNQPGFEGEF